MDKKALKVINTLNKRSKQKSRECLFHDCKLKAIDSHLLQRKGIISELIEDNHVVEMAIDLFKKPPFYFKYTGWKDAFVFPGFCTTHDNELFKSVETGDVNYYSYRSQLLLSYRASMIEKRKKEIMVDFYDRILGSSTLKAQLSPEYFSHTEEKKRQNLLGINDEKSYEELFISNIIEDSKRDFEFITFELPKVEMCSSAVFTYETTEEINMIQFFEPERINNPLTQIYFNMIPKSNSTIVIFGCLKERKGKCWDYINNFNQNDSRLSFKKISDLLLNQVENWIFSKTFYKSNILPRKDEIIKLSLESMKNTNERKELDFNLFE